MVLATSGLRLSFQRFCARTQPVFRSAPRSHGALPCAASGPVVWIPLASEEGIWIGCRMTKSVASIGVLLHRYGRAPALATARRVGHTDLMVIAGFRNNQGFMAIDRKKPVERIELVARSSSNGKPSIRERVNLVLVDPLEFTTLSGVQLPPFDPTAQFGGHRLF